MFQLLFRNSPERAAEIAAGRKYFLVSTNRAAIQSNSTIIGRYCAQPFFKELIETLSIFNSRPINDLDNVEYVNSMAWVLDLGERTPKTWFEGEFGQIPCDTTTVAKGKIRSIRERWSTDMLCDGSPTARGKLYNRLLDNDSLREQGIVFREYIPLVKFGDSFAGMPIANEWRLFFYKDLLIDYGYYWISHREEKKENLPKEALTFALNCAKLVGNKANFYTMDIAEKESGGWTVIELNEGQQSGLCGIDADSFYSNLKEILNA